MGGTVIVAYTVDAQGATRYVRVVSAAPAEIFNHDAVDAVKRWRYAPAMVDNAAVAVPTRSTIRFTPQ
jgi:protein TonB